MDLEPPPNPHSTLMKSHGELGGTTPLSSFPISVYYIIGNEFCERFNYYGVSAILYIYLTSSFQFDRDTSTSFVHAFKMFNYFFPLIGKSINLSLNLIARLSLPSASFSFSIIFMFTSYLFCVARTNHNPRQTIIIKQ